MGQEAPLPDDPYKLLGVSPQASLDEIRRAYRRAALQLHPDCARGEHRDLAEQFAQVTAAYRRLARAARRRETARTRRQAYTPQDLFYQSVGWDYHARPDVRPVGDSTVRRLTRPTVNEPAWFLAMWFLALGISATATAWVVGSLEGHLPDSGGLGMAISVALYLAIMGLTVLVLVRSRQVVWQVRALVSWSLQRLLPGPQGRLPRRPDRS